MATNKKTATKKAEIIENNEVTDTEEAVVTPKVKNWKFDDTVLIDVQSNVFGKLVYLNPRSGMEVKWEEFGDIQTMTMGDLRAMRSSQRQFFENNWVYVKSVADFEYEDAKPEDVYKALMVSQYYKDVIEPDNFNSIFRMDDKELERRVSMMSDGAKMNLVVACNEAIRRGKLDSIRKVRILERVLGCELLELT